MVPELSPVIRFRRKLHWKAAYWWYSPFMLQWLVLIVFSTIQYHRFALTHDFAIYWQALWLIAHGHLNPYSTIAGFPFLDNHFELILWPLAIFYWLWPHASLLLYMQNSALVGGEMIAWSWLNSWVTRQPASWQSWFRITGLILLVANPWVYWTAAFDFHSESLMVLTVTGMAYALWRRNHRLLVLWTLGTLSIGDVAALLVTGLGLTALALRRWKTGVSLVTSGILWLGLVESIGADKGSILSPSYGYLASGIAHLTLTTLVLHLMAHPGQALHVLWQRRANLWANMSPAGFLGVFSPWGIGVVLTALLPSSMTSYILFSEPGFQNIPVMGLITLGSVFTLAWIGRHVRWRFTVPLLSLVLLINMVGWAIFWLPRIPSTWIRVGPEQSHTLNTIRHLIPASAEVIAPQAVIGRFAGRSTVYPMMGSTAFPLTPHVPHYVVMAPYQGIHLGSIALMASQLEDLAQMSRARLIGEHHGIYLWQIRGSAPLQLPRRQALPAWAFGSQTGKRVVGSAPAHWYVAGLGRNGNVLDQAYWREPPGTYHVAVRLSGWGPAQIQVWDASTGHLIAKREVPLTRGAIVTDHYAFSFNAATSQSPYAGWGPWQTQPVPSPSHNQLEVRVYAKASSMINVYTVALQPRF